MSPVVGVSIHAPAGGATRSPARAGPVSLGFDPRPRRGGEQRRRYRQSLGLPFRSTPPHGGRRGGGGGDRRLRRVSIHAPARGATPRPRSGESARVSIHAPAGGATGPLLALSAMGGFDPRPRTGGDRHRHLTPVRRIVFRSTPPRGGRQPLTGCFARHLRFQSTPPHGGRPSQAVIACRCHCEFRSTPPHGGRRHTARVHRSRSSHVSIHAPARGATCDCRVDRAIDELFQSTPPHGGRLSRLDAASDVVSVSIHAPARGATSSPLCSPRCIRCFNPRPRTGGDQMSAVL